MVINQAYLFLIFTLNGVCIGLIFDLFRILRKSFKTSNLIIYIQDILFWIFTGISIVFFMYNYSDGSIRLYMILGLILGFLLYLLTISKYIIKVFVFIICIIKRIIIRSINIINMPIQFTKNLIKKTVVKHSYTLFLKVQQIFTKHFNKKYLKMSKKM